MTQLKRVLIMAGGTGGHVFPGLAVAHALREEGIEVHWLGTATGLEARLVPEAALPLHIIPIQGLRKKGWWAWFKAPYILFLAIKKARQLLRQIKPNVILGMGGFVSGPGGIASWLSGYPLIIHEQNAKAGLTNKLLFPLAAKVLTAFPSVFPQSPKVLQVGNPVRAAMEQFAPPDKRAHSNERPLHLLVIGGSLGAQVFNQIMPLVGTEVGSEKLCIYHQSGQASFTETQAIYAAHQLKATVVPFIEDMASVYEWADIVLCRAGALTVAELCAAGVGAIMVPYPHAVDDHQTLNARFLVEKGAAIMIPQSQLTAQSLSRLLQDFYLSRSKCLAMANAAYRLRNINVANKIVSLCKEIST